MQRLRPAVEPIQRDGPEIPEPLAQGVARREGLEIERGVRLFAERDAQGE